MDADASCDVVIDSAAWPVTDGDVVRCIAEPTDGSLSIGIDATVEIDIARARGNASACAALVVESVVESAVESAVESTALNSCPRVEGMDDGMDEANARVFDSCEDASAR